MIFKKLTKYILFILSLILLLEFSLVTLDKKFFEKISQEEAAKQNLSKDEANAIKHSYAASLFYSGFRALFFNEVWAKNMVIFLGKTNEIAEIIFKTNRDSSLEMAKDFYNNLVGISAAKILEKQMIKETRIKVIGDLASCGVLLLSRENLNLIPEEKNHMRQSYEYKLASRWFDNNYQEIEKEIVQKIQFSCLVDSK